MSETLAISTAFIPAVTINLKEATPKSFQVALDEFHDWSKTQVREPLKLPNGWHTVDRPLAEKLLVRNPPGANRKAKLASVRYYAEQMLADDWQKTGQPLILTDQGILIDGQHRCWACYFTDKPFVTYIISDVEHFANIFAYIDSGKSRTATDALTTAGFDGQSSQISQAVFLNHLYENNALKVKGSVSGIARPTHVEVLRTTINHPALVEAAHLQLAEYKTATDVIKFKPVAVFFAWQIVENFNADALDEFMSALGEASIPMFASLRKTFHDDLESSSPMSKAGRLAYLIKAFNAWYTKQTIKRVTVRIDEEFPRFIHTNTQLQEAAE
jgi:hypothetical protein